MTQLSDPPVAAVSNDRPSEISERAKTGRAWISEGLLVATMPVAAYSLTLAYIDGFAGFFRIPSDFLSINIGTMFATASNLLIPAFLVLWVFFTAYSIMPMKNHPVAEKWTVILPLVALLFMKVLLFESHWQEWLPTLLTLAIFAIYLFRRKTPARLSWGDKRLSRYVQTDAFQRLVTLYLFAWVALTVAHDTGRASAMFQQEYLVPINRVNTVILTSFGDNLIVGAFDSKSKEVNPGFSVLKKGEDPNLVLRWERVGPLHLKQAAAGQ